MIITIDGPVGTGKSTIAKKLAEMLGFIYFDTGAMYRCLTFGVIKHKINPDDPKQMEAYLKTFDFTVQVIEGHKHYYFEGQDISQDIRKDPVTSLVSKVSAIGPVREKLVDLQRKLGHGVNAVFEGRDMGTVVFPKAEVKIFLTASSEVRAQRRLDELKQKFPKESLHLTLQEILESVDRRDALDSQRELSPLKQADDAHIIDTSLLSIDEVVNIIIRIKDTRT